jgi:hypothetical protein
LSRNPLNHEGRLVVELAGDGDVRARCRGGGAVYRLGFVDGRWWCGCPARGRCSHLAALELVVAVTLAKPEPALDGGSA